MPRRNRNARERSIRRLPYAFIRRNTSVRVHVYNSENAKPAGNYDPSLGLLVATATWQSLE